MTHPCCLCEFQATSARQLSRHKAVTHVKNPLSCILCPFVTAYQTNLLRHRREVHGILGSKGNKSCKFCGFEADDNDTLIMHQQQAHQDILKSARERFAREKKSARGNCAVNSDNELETTQQDLAATKSNLDLDLKANSSSKLMNFNFSNLTKDLTSTFNSGNHQNQDSSNHSEHSLNDDDFWKEGFIDNPISLMNFNQFSQTNSLTSNLTSNFLANFQKNFNSTFKFNNSSNSPFDLNSFNNNLNSLNNLNGLNGINNLNDLNALNCYNSFNSSNNNNNNSNHNLTYQEEDMDSPESNQSSEVSNLSRPESRNSNLAIDELPNVDNLSPEIDLNEMSSNNQDEIDQNEEEEVEEGEEDDDDDDDDDDGDDDNNNSANIPNELNNEIATTSSAAAVVNSNNNDQELAPTKIRRQYTCTDCDFRTVNPREFLYHRRDVHNQKVKIVECPYCVYACQYFQKLQRHMLLVHKLETTITPPIENSSFVKTQIMINQSQVYPTKKDFFIKKSSSKSSTNSKTATEKRADNADAEIEQQSNEEENYDTNLQSSEQLFESKTKSSTKSSSPSVVIRKSTSGQSRSSSKKSIEDKHQQQQSTSSSSTLATTANKQQQQMVDMIKCKYCRFQTDSFSKLEKHESQFHLEKRYQCPFCEIKFENLVWLTRHLLHMHQNNEKAHQIVQTLELIMPSKRKRMKSSHQLNNAINSATAALNDNQISGEFDLNDLEKLDKNCTKCSICNYETKWFSELQKHMRVHISEKPFRCQLCSFRTKWKGDLNRHVHKYHAKAISELQQQQKQQSNLQATSINQQINDDNLDEFNGDDNNLQIQTTNYNEYPYHHHPDEDLENYSINEEDELIHNNAITNETASHNIDNDLQQTDQIDYSTILNSSSNQQQQQFDFKQLLEPQINSFETSSSQQQKSISSSVPRNENLVKVYKCSYCEFICTTASRFHVHFLQHLNTKPFMCSVCEHVS